MNIRFEHIGRMSTPEREAFLREIAENDAVLKEYAIWLAISKQVRSRQEQHFADRSVLVLAALQRAGMETHLTDDERSRLDDTWPQIEQSGEHTALLDYVMSRIESDVRDFDESWKLRENHLRPHGTEVPDSSRPARQRPISRVAWRITAVAATLIFLGILLFVARRDADVIRFDVPAGEIQNVTMLDGSIIRLLGPSEMSYRGTDARVSRPEHVRLTGDAFFDIVGADAPFQVETATATVTVLGTSFGVRSDDDQTGVVVVSGEVAVESRARNDFVTTLTAGQTCVVLRNEVPSNPVEVNLSEALAWAKLFVFRKTRLSEIAATLSEHYGVDVTVERELETKTITGTFDRSRPLEEILDTLAKTLGANVVNLLGGYRLSMPS